MLQKAVDPLDTRHGAFTNPFETNDFDGSADDLASLGVQIHRSDRAVPVHRPAADG